MSESILAIDVGGGTQDILIFEEGKTVENCIKLVVPSQTVIVAKRVEEATRKGAAIFLNGNLMGGGASTGAIKRHLKAGLSLYATPNAALTINDDLNRVEEMGITITSNPPAGVVEISMRDVDLDSLERALELFAVPIPQKYSIAVQDHGESIGQSNREFRFIQWKKFIERGGDINELAYFKVPVHFTRMRAVQKDLPGALVMDTGSAAIWGALCDPKVAEAAEKGMTIVNVGNQHTVGALIKDRRVLGLFEHHTGIINEGSLMDYVKKLQAGTLTHEEVFNSRGHGAYISPEAKEYSFKNIVVTGPNRHYLSRQDVYFAAPYGDMMLTGSFGLVAAYYNKQGKDFNIKL